MIKNKVDGKLPGASCCHNLDLLATINIIKHGTVEMLVCVTNAVLRYVPH